MTALAIQRFASDPGGAPGWRGTLSAAALVAVLAAGLAPGSFGQSGSGSGSGSDTGTGSEVEQVVPLYNKDALLQTTPRTGDERRPVSGDALYNSIETSVRITDQGNHTIEEHRVGSNRYMIKVNPKNAPSYYLVDDSGSGNFEWRRGQVAPPQWAIMRW